MRASRATVLFVASLVAAWFATPTFAQDAAEWKGFEAGYETVLAGSRQLARGEESGHATLQRGRAMLRANIDRYPYYGPNYYGLALADFAEDRDEKAEAHLNRCLERNPDYGPARMRLIRMLLRQDRVEAAIAVLDWFSPDVPDFDEQVDHFTTASLVNEYLGRHDRAFECAREAFDRDITKWIPEPRQVKRPGEPDVAPPERTVDYEKGTVQRMLWVLAVNGWMAERSDAAAWLAELRRVPAVAESGLPFEFQFLAVARRFRDGEREAIAAHLGDRVIAESDDANAVLGFLEGYEEYLAKPGSGPRRRLYNAGPRDWYAYFERTLASTGTQWREFVASALPAHFWQRSEQVHEVSPADAAKFATLSFRFDDSEVPPEKLLYLAECYHGASMYGEAIEVLDRAIAMEPSYGYKYRKLRERCERAQRRSRPRR